MHGGWSSVVTLGDRLVWTNEVHQSVHRNNVKSSLLFCITAMSRLADKDAIGDNRRALRCIGEPIGSVVGGEVGVGSMDDSNEQELSE